jgi:hypothetical protein
VTQSDHKDARSIPESTARFTVNAHRERNGRYKPIPLVVGFVEAARFLRGQLFAPYKTQMSHRLRSWELALRFRALIEITEAPQLQVVLAAMPASINFQGKPICTFRIKAKIATQNDVIFVLCESALNAVAGRSR